RLVLLPLDLLEHVEHAVHRVRVDRVLLPARRRVAFRVIALDLDGQSSRVVGHIVTVSLLSIVVELGAARREIGTGSGRGRGLNTYELRAGTWARSGRPSQP